jgi:hypothetical protein
VTHDQRTLTRIWGYRLALARCDNDLDALERIIDELYEADIQTRLRPLSLTHCWMRLQSWLDPTPRRHYRHNCCR